MKITDIFFSRNRLFASFVDGEHGGQILWHGEIGGKGFWVFPFAAEEIEPVTDEQVRCHFKDFQVIRKLDKSEYPVFIEEIKNYCATVKPLVIYF